MRTLYACVGEHETELSFEPNQIITSGEISFIFIERFITSHNYSSTQLGAWLVRREPGWEDWSCSRKLRRICFLIPVRPSQPAAVLPHNRNLVKDNYIAENIKDFKSLKTEISSEQCAIDLLQ